MLTFNGTFKNVDEFATHILNGLYDVDIYRYLHDLGMEDGFEGFADNDPTTLFEFSVTFSEDNNKHLYIAPWDFNNCGVHNGVFDVKERKVALLLRSVINDKYKALPKCIIDKYERRMEDVVR